MERLRAALRAQDYEPLHNDTTSAADDDHDSDGVARDDRSDSAATTAAPPPFRWPEYAVFLLLGVSMLWAWNMFLAAGPYLAQRLASSAWLAANFQAAELSVSTVVALLVTLLLTTTAAGKGAGRGRSPSYAARIALALVVNAVGFALLAASTELATGVEAEVYFGFVVAIVAATSVATGLFQNGIFAFVAGFGVPGYTQGIMVGQAVAGVLPCVAQIGLVLALTTTDRGAPAEGGAGDDAPPPVPSSAALAYFLTAVGISGVSILAFSWLLRRKAAAQLRAEVHSDGAAASSAAKTVAVPMRVLARKLRLPALALFFVFAITMTFPVFTQKIVSVTPVDQASRILFPSAFIPLAFLFWNTGDLIGRLLTAYPRISLTHRPLLLLVLSLARVIWIPMYHLCNINGGGARISSDLFYLLVVQLGFGISNGYVGSSCMIGIANWVDPEERESAGAFMGLCLVFGLAAGSLLSFLIS